MATKSHQGVSAHVQKYNVVRLSGGPACEVGRSPVGPLEVTFYLQVVQAKVNKLVCSSKWSYNKRQLSLKSNPGRQ